ncbi:tRNA (adenosine(37)-N6)-threonylcarbamoyltransferase complex ATPase subunit type 1 TsaE [Spiroplasma endosymbiont of Labia minor]|uniref:tRNA (adenosine(37)-N6)-threonylcarbamoyltransferase complex ATPase subunit type 1 TsaE n=1 Tax=Spiroplasma endosymbiont of Labia minor TaxID=3066305 RepID=UPI0030CD7D8F
MQYIIKNIQDWNEIIKKIKKFIKPNNFLFLSGELGTGKTAFTKLLLKSFGVENNVTSPSFVILNTYFANGLTINHMDAYRLNFNEDMALYDELFDSSFNIIEWPDNVVINNANPKNTIKMKITLSEDNEIRIVNIESTDFEIF